jgi:hypothetical protein
VVPGADPICIAGACAVGQCQPGLADCDGDPANGCETDTLTAPSSCGVCGAQCPALPNTLPGCVNGICTQVCAPGFGDCSPYALGCETDLTTDVQHCGACGNDCTAIDFAFFSCVAGACVIDACFFAGTADCDGNPYNGCEATPADDPWNCGTCGHVCSAPHQGQCQNGACGCDYGWADCDGDPANGCEVDLDHDPHNCHTCGHVCPSPGGTPVCDLGACKITCSPGRADCNGWSGDGCETDLASPYACGSCGHTCAAPDECHAFGTCDAATMTCSNPPVPDGTWCLDTPTCWLDPTCTGGVCGGTVIAFPGYVCRFAQSECDLDEVCDGTSSVCPSDAVKPAGTPCTSYAGPGACDGTGQCVPLP